MMSPYAPRPRKIVVNGIQEDDLDVEDDERHRDQVELHREALGRLVLGHDAALVRCFLGRCRPLRSEERRSDERQEHEQHDEHDHAEDRQVVAHARPLLRHTDTALLRAGYPNRAPTMPARRGRDPQTSSSDFTRSKRCATSGQLTRFQYAATQSFFTFLYCR